ncbi:unnamed protein product [Soboliphyme baturini]|uniref:Glyco_hydro_18 domain-containing protein n=1 Tax=Soboliphyme baturini TaxID=241478 RepID=A0A183I9R3_9BILA|nr:unnamed protein product [Soboliphyme baturini]
MPENKIVIGLATYARGWTLSKASDSKVGAAASGPAKQTTFVREAGVASYYEICKMIEQGAKRYFDDEAKVPYIVMGDQWFSYDDVESFDYKLDVMMKNKYKGAFVWTLDFDDFNGQCQSSKGKKYPLLRRMKDKLSRMGSEVSCSLSLINCMTNLFINFI